MILVWFEGLSFFLVCVFFFFFFQRFCASFLGDVGFLRFSFRFLFGFCSYVFSA